jgi:hypothetical protein
VRPDFIATNVPISLPLHGEHHATTGARRQTDERHAGPATAAAVTRSHPLAVAEAPAVHGHWSCQQLHESGRRLLDRQIWENLCSVSEQPRNARRLSTVP